MPKQGEENPLKDNKLLLDAFGGDKKLLDDFKRFQDKEKQREIKRELELKTQEILENELQKDNEKAIEILNRVYRKAWTLACKQLNQDEAEFPSRY